MSRSKKRPSAAFESLDMEHLEEKRLLTTTPLNVPQTPIDVSSYIADVETIGQQELLVRQHLSADAETRYLQQGDSGLRLVEVKYGAAGIYNRFMQTWNGVDVHNSWVTVNQGADGSVQQVFHAGHDNIVDNEVKPQLSSIDQMMAERAALRNLEANSTFAESKSDLVWTIGEKGQATLAYQITVYPLSPLGDWLTLIDANSFKVIQQENRIAHATGNGDVFDPNPWQTQGDGTGLDDNNDATSSTLEAQHIDVTLQGLDDGTGLLIGEFVDLATLDSPTLPDVDADEATRQYYYDRDDPRFEQVVVYYSVDGMNRYFHSLGFDDDSGATANGIRDFPTLANAHWDNADNSFYSTGDEAIHFGDGGVDDAEDADIVAHEYGHAVQHNQNASWGGGEMGAMGEGFGDYLAASFYFASGDAAFQADHAACVGEWDATSYSSTDPPCLRRVDGNKMYPDDIGGGVHADGEIWSRALWDIRAALGGPTADQIILESHFGLPGGSLMPAAAEQILLADQNLNGGANQVAIRQAFIDRGILEPLPTEGTVTLNQGTYNVMDTIEVTVVDSNVSGSTVDVQIVVSNGDTETLTLADQGDGVFFATIDTVPGTPGSGDGQLQVALDDVVEVTYNDSDDGTGNPSSSTASAVISTVQKYNSTDIPISIVSNTTITSTIEITDVALVADLNVGLDITHTFDADLDVFLIAPDGTRVELFTDVGGGDDNFTDTMLDDEAAESIVDGTAPFTGSYQPEGQLADLIGIPLAGIWTLEITDDAGGDEGTLNAWSMCIETSDAGEGSVEFDRELYNITDPVLISVFDGNAVGPLQVDVTSSGGDVETVTLADQGMGLFVGTIDTADIPFTENDGVLQVEIGDDIEVTYIDLDDGSGNSATVSDTAQIASIFKFDSPNVPVTIEAGPHLSTIVIPNDGVVANLDVTLDIDHTFAADLDVFLIAPNGTRIELFTDVGGGGDNFTDTTLDDDAATPIADASAPFTGSFQPEGSLGALTNLTAAGTWTLEINDDFPFDADSGVLNSWSICVEIVPDPTLQEVEVVGPPILVEGDDGSTNAVFEVRLDAPSTGFRSVEYRTVDGSATAGLDYEATIGRAQFGLGDSVWIVEVPVYGDVLAEDMESFQLELFDPFFATISTGIATAEIQDDEVYSLGKLIDFGTQGSPIELDAIGIANLEYDLDHGFGWQPGALNLQTIDSAVGTDTQRDIAAYDTATFLVDVVNPGAYQITIEVGDNDAARETTVMIEGQSFGTVSTTAGQFASNTYSIDAQDGQLTIELIGGANGGAVTSMTIAEPAPTNPLASKMLDGVVSTGQLSDIHESDDTHMAIDPSPTTNPVKQVVDMLLISQAPGTSPTSLSYRLEASMVGGPEGDVLQIIDLWDEQAGQWEQIHSSVAAIADSVVQVQATGDVSRFVHPITSETLARVSWVSPGFSGAPFTWSINVDQAVWIFDGSSGFNKGGNGNSGGEGRSNASGSKLPDAELVQSAALTLTPQARTTKAIAAQPVNLPVDIDNVENTNDCVFTIPDVFVMPTATILQTATAESIAATSKSAEQMKLHDLDGVFSDEAFELARSEYGF